MTARGCRSAARARSASSSPRAQRARPRDGTSIAPRAASSELRWEIGARRRDGGARDRLQVAPAGDRRPYRCAPTRRRSRSSTRRCCIARRAARRRRCPGAAASGRRCAEARRRPRRRARVHAPLSLHAASSSACRARSRCATAARWDAWIASACRRTGRRRTAASTSPPTGCRASDVLTAYVLAIATAAGWQLPERVARRAWIEALTRFVSGTHRARLRAADAPT